MSQFIQPDQFQFSEDAKFEKYLIEEVKHHRLLYDRHHPDNLRRHLTDDHWNQVRKALEAKQIIKTTDECKHEWRKIYQQRRTVVTKYGPKHDKGKHYATDITWLNQYLLKNSQKSSQTGLKRTRKQASTPKHTSSGSIAGTSKQPFNQMPSSSKTNPMPPKPMSVPLTKTTYTPMNPIPKPSISKEVDDFPQLVVFEYLSSLDASIVSNDQIRLLSCLDKELEKEIVGGKHLKVINFNISGYCLEITVKNDSTRRVLINAFHTYCNNNITVCVHTHELRRNAMRVRIYHPCDINRNEILTRFKNYNQELVDSSWVISPTVINDGPYKKLTVSMNEKSILKLVNQQIPNRLNFGIEGTVLFQFLPIK